MVSVLGKSQILFRGLPADEGGTVKAYIKLGGQDANQYKITGETEGKQIFRTQYDLAIDGTEYILTAGVGQGEYHFVIFEGPFDCADAQGPVFMSRLHELKDFERRSIDVDIPFNKSKHAFFSGIIIGASFSQKMDKDGSYRVYTTVNTIGTWR